MAFFRSKKVVPFKTGLMRSSYTMDKETINSVKVYFDPSKILGKMRLGVRVKSYYPRYLSQYPKTFNWMDLVIRTFLHTLLAEIRDINEQTIKFNGHNLPRGIYFVRLTEKGKTLATKKLIIKD